MTKFLALLLLPIFLLGQTNYSDKIDQYMKAQADLYNFSGTVLVKKNNKIIYLKAFGQADQEWLVDNTTDTKYRVCSITKQFTAAAILILEQRGKLSVNDKLNKYFKDFPKGDKVTIHMLLSHKSGIADYSDQPEYIPMYSVPNENKKLIALMTKNKYDFEPGTDFKYSNSNYFLLACIIEQVSKQTYSAFLDENIFSKANMLNSLVDNSDTVVSRRAVGYGFWDNHYVHEYYAYMPNALGCGNILSTVEDLNKWDNALLGTNILNESSKTKMYTPYSKKELYGYGYCILSLQNKTCIQHSGGDGGFRNSIVRIPSDSSCVVVISNNMSSSPIISFALAGIIIDAPISIPKKHIQNLIDTSILKKYVGNYQENYMGITYNSKIIQKSGKLFEYVNGADDVELKPETEKVFFTSSLADRQLIFDTDSKGNVTRVWRNIAGLQVDLIKK
jgi:CubicO group peptidase (beta-lactamase class C family)